MQEEIKYPLEMMEILLSRIARKQLQLYKKNAGWHTTWRFSNPKK